jgi:predicted phage tail protein
MPRLVDDQLFGTDRKVVDPDLIDGGLRSKQFATILDLLGYGEIDSIFDEGGFGTDTFRKNVFLDGTPLQNANGEENFSDVEVFFKNGASDQTALQEINAIENTIPVAVEVTKDTPVTRSITDTNVDKVRVSIQIPSLQNFKDDGDITGTEVKISIQIVENNGTIHNPVVEDSIDGKATSPFVKDYEIKFEKTMSFPVSITVIRNTDDSAEARLQNKTNFLSLTEINTDTSAYQGFAYVGIRFNAQEFQSYPKRSYRLKGTKIKVPHGTTIDSNNGRVIYPADYTFNGTFKTDKEWCSDPAWILYDILTTDKGFGGTDGVIDADTLDVFSFYSASAYNSQLITDPITETTEPRFSCNVILNQKNDAYSLINDLCSVMRAMPFYSVGSLTLSQDRPTDTATNTSDAQYIFTNANVSEQGFTYTGVGQKTKFTEVEVSYFDNDTQTLNFEYVSADEITALSGYTAKFGKIRKTLKSFACTSRGQANRLARWFLYTNLKESELCSFKATLEAGVVVRPSMIIGIADSLRAGVRRGGRIKSVTNSTTIVVDDANNTDLTAENSATLSVIMPDGSTESRSISSISETTITVSSAFSTSPQANSIWAIENTTVEFQTYRVLGIEETNHCEYNISAIIHDTNKYAQVEDTSVPANPRTITTLLDEKPSPSNLTATEQIVVLNNRAVSKIFVSWQPEQGVKEYLFEFQFENDNPERLRVSRPSFELFESRLGTYKFAVKSFNTLGKLSSSTSTFSFTAVGKTEVPEDPTNLTVEPVSEEFVRLRFDPSTSVDVTHGGNVIVRHTPETGSDATFANSTEIIPKLSGNISETLVPALTGTYSIKFRDDGGRVSTNAAKVVVTEPDPQPHQVVFTEREDQDSPAFQGAKVSTFFSSDLSALVLTGAILIDKVTDFDNISNFDDQGDSASGPVASSGSYEFLSPIDMGAKFNLTLKRRILTESSLTNTLFDDRTGNLDIWTDFDGLVSQDVNAKLLVATTDLDPTTSVSATYEQSGTTITVTKTSHGYAVGDFVVIDFAAGGATDGNYEIQTVATNSFTVTSTTSATISSGTSCSYGANFTRFNLFVNGEYKARGYKFKCELTSGDPAQNIKVTQLGYEASVKRRIETVNTAIASACATNNAAKTVSFSTAFFTGTSVLGGSTTAFLPSVGITLEGAVSGDYFKITSVTGSQFVIETRDSSNNFKDLSFKYTAIGFGRST